MPDFPGIKERNHLQNDDVHRNSPTGSSGSSENLSAWVKFLTGVAVHRSSMQESRVEGRNKRYPSLFEIKGRLDTAPYTRPVCFIWTFSADRSVKIVRILREVLLLMRVQGP